MAPEVTHRQEVFARLGELMAASAVTGTGLGVLVIRIGALRSVMLGGGYAESDRLLSEACTRLASVARRSDWLARIGDQDFVLLLPGIIDSGQLLLAANKVLRTAAACRHVRDGAVPIEFTIGIAAFPQHGTRPEQVLWAAERALALAEQRAISIEVFSSDPTERDSEQWRMQALFADAMDRGELELNYQPKITLATGTLAGLEALSRWMSPEIGSVSPEVFVSMAEDSNHIEKLTWSTVNSALQQLAEWRSEGFDPPVAVNLSSTCLRATDLSERVRNALSLWNVPGSSLTLEVTESAVMPNPERSFAILQDLRRLGVRVSIDDFGTGYSSFAYFRTLPADELKIDRSFVARLTSSAADCHLVQSLIDLAHRFELTVVAEGIEDTATAGILTDMGCDIGQGYYFGRPAAASEVRATARALPSAA
jgi:diguanylate cyclase (GGDEF)-like protein